MKGCQEITELIEKGKLTSLPTSDRMALRVHLLFCKLCREFKKDSEILDKALKRALSTTKEIAYSPAEKEALITILTNR